MTSRLPRPMTAALVAALLVPLTGALAGCEARQVGAAAIVNKKPLAIDELQDLTRDYAAVVPGADEGQAQQQILNRVIISAVIDRAASRVGVSASRGEVAAERDRVLGQVGNRRQLLRVLAQSQEVVAPSRVNRWARDRVLFGKILDKVAAGRNPNSEEVNSATRGVFVDAAKSMRVEVNPRYGRWDPNRLQLTPEIGGGLSRPAHELAEGDGNR